MKNITVTVTGLPDNMSDTLVPDLFAELAKQAIHSNAARIIINLQYGEKEVRHD